MKYIGQIIYCSKSNKIFDYWKDKGFYWLFDGEKKTKALPYCIYLAIKEESAIFIDEW